MDNRAAICSAALELFSARGYDGVGVQEIVEAAGITKPTLYHYFGSKLGLLKTLFETYHTRLNGGVAEAAVYHGDLPLSLEHVARTCFEFARQEPVYYRMQLAVNFAPRHSEAYPVAAGWNEDMHRVVEALFASASADHGNMVGRQRFYAATFMGLINTCIVLWLNGYADLDEALLQRMTRQFQHGIYS